MTVGRTELTTMNEKMDQAKNMRQPVWERIKKDLSTNKSKIRLGAHGVGPARAHVVYRKKGAAEPQEQGGE